MKQIKELYINGIHPAVAKLNFNQLVWKLSESAEAKMKRAEVELAELEYRKHLTLKKLYPGVDLVPSRLVDELWHAHILDTAAYRRDCDSVFGYFIDHYPYFGIYGEDDQNKLASAFEETKVLYEQHFGLYPEEINCASRCTDHPCHVPSSCACRAPGTCN